MRVSPRSCSSLDRVAVESDLVCRTNKEVDGVLVIHNHLRFRSTTAFRFLPELNEAFCIEQRICISL
jgi:hypothetical protein